MTNDEKLQNTWKKKTCAQTRFTVFKMKTKQYEHLKKIQELPHLFLENQWRI